MKLNPLLMALFAGWAARAGGASENSALEPFNAVNDSAPIMPVPSQHPVTNTTVTSAPSYLPNTTTSDYILRMRNKLIQDVANGAPIFSVTIKVPMPEQANEEFIIGQVKNVLNRKHKKTKGRGLRGAEDGSELSISDILEKNYSFVANATSTASGISISLLELSLKDAELIMQLAQEPENGTTAVKSINLISVDDAMEPVLDSGRRELSAASVQENYKSHPNLDYLDGVGGGRFWINEIGIVGKGMMYGQLDSGLHQKHVDTVGMQINTYQCTNGVKCTYSQVSANLPLQHRIDNYDVNGHGTHVYGDAVRVAPGLMEVDNYQVLDATGHGGYEMIEFGIDSCIDRLKQLQSEADNAGLKPNKYILNASIGFRNFGAIPGIISEQQAKLNSVTIDRIVAKIKRMHKDYPWFQMVAAAGNSGFTSEEMPGNIAPVIAVASHDKEFASSPTTNTHPAVVAVTAIGVGVTSTGNIGATSTTVRSGTSMASPLVAVSLGLLWELFPNLKNTELKQLIKELSIDPSEYSWSGTFPIKNKIFNINIDRCIELAKSAGSNQDHKYFVKPELLTKMQAKASTYALDNLPVGSNPIFTLPNSNPVPLPVYGVASYTIDLAKSTAGNLRVSFSNKRVALWDPSWDEIGYQDIAQGSFFFKPFEIPVKANTNKITITITRGRSPGSTIGGAKATFVVKDQNNNILLTITDAPVAGYGNLSNLMIALSRSSPNIVVKSYSGNPESTMNTHPSTQPAVIFTPAPTKQLTQKPTVAPTKQPTLVAAHPIVLTLQENGASLVKLVPNNNIIEITFGNKKLLIKNQTFTLFKKNSKGQFEINKGVQLPGFAPVLEAEKEITFRFSSVAGKLVLDLETTRKLKGTKKPKKTYSMLCEVPLDGAQYISFAQVDSSKSQILPNQRKVTKGL